MSDAMSNPELLSPGNQAAEIGAGGQEYLGSGSVAGAGEFHQPTWAEENPVAAAAALIRASAAGRVELSPTVGVPDPIEDYFAKMATPEGLRKLQEFLARPDVVSWDEDKVVPIKNTPGLPLGEMKRVVAAIQARQGKGKSVEQLVREARRPAPPSPAPPPERQLASRPGDWREVLPPDQKRRLQVFEAKIANLDVSQLQIALGRLKQLQAVAPIEGWQSKEIQEADADLCLKIVDEKLKSAFPNQVNQLSPERLDPTKNLSADARAHLQYLIDKFKQDKNLEKLDFPDLVAYVQAEYKKAGLVGRNAPAWLLPPHLKGELLPIFGLSLEIPLPLEPKEKNARA